MMDALSAALPSVHGGHSSIDNHRPWNSGFSPDDAEGNPFRPETCPACPGRSWCYNLQRPPTVAERVANLAAIYQCYQYAAAARKVQPFCVTVHAPFPPPFQQWYEARYQMPYRDAKVQMPVEDFPDFLSASAGLQFRAVEFEILPKAFQAEHECLLAEVARNHPAIIRIGSLHHLETEDEIVRMTNQHGELERAQALFHRLGAEAFWLLALRMTLGAVQRMDLHVLGHPFGWHKRMPAPCPVTTATKRMLRRLARSLTSRGIALDLNTSGFVKGNCRDNPYFPGVWVPLFLEEGVRFTAGDDSHNQRQVGQAYEQLLAFCEEYEIRQLWKPVFLARRLAPMWTPETLPDPVP